jgi:signal transduction histidine kinase
VCGLLVCAGAVALASAGARPGEAFGRGILEFLIVAVPMASGVFAWHAPWNASFGLALYMIGLGWSLTALGESASSIPYTAGRLADWLVFPCVVYLLLAFPTGTIARGLDQLLMIAVVAISLVLFYGTAPLVSAFPPHTPWATCTSDCPANALEILKRPPSFLPDLVYAREWLVMALWAGLFVSMARRWRAASVLQRRAMLPVFTAAAFLGVCHVAFHATRELAAPSEVVTSLGSIWTLLIVVVCVAFTLGLLWQRLLLAVALSDLGTALRANAGPAAARDALAAAVRDPTLDLVHRDPTGTWRNTAGDEVAFPPPDRAGRATTPVETQLGRVDAVLVHDAALSDDPQLLDGVCGLLRTAWHDRTDTVEARAIADSRRRAAEREGADRIRLEQDLHDGAQQFMLALKLKLARLAEHTAGSGLGPEVTEIIRVADETSAEIRRISQGIYPSALAERGVAEALRELPSIPGLTLEIRAEELGRLPGPVERALYYSTVEAIQNATKHSGAPRVVVRLARGDRGALVEIADQGCGFDLEQVGSSPGLTGMRDRIEAVGGSARVDSAPGRGTTVRFLVPLGEPAARA